MSKFVPMRFRYPVRQRARPAPQSALVLILVLIMVGCERKPSPIPDAKPSASADSSREARPGETKRAVFRMSVSSGGGFTGIYAGCTLASDGTVSHWQRFRGRDTTLATAAGSAATILDLRRKLVGSGALSIRKDESGNMTTRVELIAADSAYSWSWSGDGANENAPPELKAWYADAAGYCSGFPIPSASEGK